MNRIILPSLIATWMAAAGLGIVSMLRYEATPSEDSHAIFRWPDTSAITRDAQKPTLLVFVHPHCPCTRATLSELSRLTARCEDQARVYVVFVKPSDVSRGWEQGQLWEDAGALHGVERFVDDDAHEANKFGVTHSGHALLFDRSGRLRFSGGITSSRGHEGDNTGASAVASIVTSGESTIDRTPVFGCPLMSEINTPSQDAERD